MEQVRKTQRPHLFVLRVWLEELGDGESEWRGDIQSARSGDKRYFCEWVVLRDFVLAQMQTARADDQDRKTIF